MRRSILILAIVGLILLAFPLAVFAADNTASGVIAGGNYTLRSGQTRSGDLLVVGGNVTIETGARLVGGILAMGGNVTVVGEVTGDIGLLGGNVWLRDTSIVRGNVWQVGGSVNREPGARVEGDTGVSEGPPGFYFNPGDIPDVDGVFRFGRFTDWDARFSLRSFVWTFIQYIFRTLLLAGLAVVVVSTWPKQANNVAQTVLKEPVATGGVGFLLLVPGAIVLALLVITICLIPVSLIGFLAMALAIAFGWIALGIEVGKRLDKLVDPETDWHPALSAAIGTFLLALLVDGIGLIPCIGWIAPLLMSSLALGGVALTRFGTRPYPVPAVAIAPAAPTLPQPPTDEPPAAPPAASS